jgi:D-xylose 1-dehydrogenase (NADP+, D-xylono-1,5-lactone-forming)
MMFSSSALERWIDMTDKVLNWGLLSTARINRALIPPLRESQRNRLAAVASRTRDSADSYAREWKIPQAYGSYEELLADPGIDVIYNSLPNNLHVEWTIKAVEAGKHVLCEKPIALRAEDVDAIQAAAKRHGRVVAEAFMYRHHPQTLKAVELVKSGALGTLRLIRGSFAYMLSRESDVRTKPELGGGSIWDVGCYPISFARVLAGEEPLEVFGWQIIGPTGIDETFVGQMRFAHDIHMQFDSSFVTHFDNYMEIIGTQGILKIPHPAKPATDDSMYLTRGDEIETIEIKSKMLYLYEVEDMADAILFGRAPRISLEDSRANIKTILAFLESAQTGKPVKLI